ncbi:hypothetical protein PFISCL1PPCAC_26335, partial [Pristionchus fissidentatus]
SPSSPSSPNQTQPVNLSMKGLPPRKAFDTVLDSRINEIGGSLEILLRHCITGDTEWKDIKKCRNYSRTMFHDYFKTQTGEKEQLYKEWRKNVNKKRREAFAAAKTGVNPPAKQRPPTIETTPESHQTNVDVQRYVEDKVREVARDVIEAERVRVSGIVQKAKADTTTTTTHKNQGYAIEAHHSGSDSDEERAHPGLLNKNDPLLNDAYYGYSSSSNRHGNSPSSDGYDGETRRGSGLASFNSAFSSFSNG